MEDYPNKACPSPTVRDITEPGWREKEKKMNEFYNSLPTREELCCGAPGKLGDGDRVESHEPVMDFYKWWYEIGSGIYKLDTEDNEEHARRVVKEAWEYVMHEMVRKHNIAIARVIESDDFTAEVSWVLNPLPPGTLLYEWPNVELRGARPYRASRSNAQLGEEE